jgi:hypothetical protein
MMKGAGLSMIGTLDKSSAFSLRGARVGRIG